MQVYGNNREITGLLTMKVPCDGPPTNFTLGLTEVMMSSLALLAISIQYLTASAPVEVDGIIIVLSYFGFLTQGILMMLLGSFTNKITVVAILTIGSISVIESSYILISTILHRLLLDIDSNPLEWLLMAWTSLIILFSAGMKLQAYIYTFKYPP